MNSSIQVFFVFLLALKKPALIGAAPCLAAANAALEAPPLTSKHEMVLF